MKTVYDVAVIGIGTMGSFACSELARRGLRVIGFDRFAPPHGRGSHSGDTRVFRIAYAENPDYVPLAIRSSELWDQYGAIGKTQLLHRCGMLSIGRPESQLIKGILESSAIFGLEAFQYSTAEIRRTFPAFAPDEGHVGIFEPAAGWIDANAAIQTAQHIAKQQGATLLLDDPVLKWSQAGAHFEITTASETVAAEKLVITAGAWTTQLLKELGLALRVERKVLTWIDPIDPTLFRSGNFPVFAFSEGFLYGFPSIGDHGVKLAVHWKRGETITDPSESLAEASLEDAIDPLAIAEKLLPKLAGPLPEALRRVKRTKNCLYVMTSDENFLIDHHPALPGVVFGAGFSGHGFKFAPVVGEILADLVTSGETKLPIAFLSASRLAVK